MSGGGKGADSYWPGFVDALTNVVIAMVFVTVVLAVSLSFSAQLLAKRMAAKVAELEQAQQNAKAAQAAALASPPTPADAPPQPTPAPGALATAVPLDLRIPVAGNESAARAQGPVLKAQARQLMLDFEPSALTLDATATQRLAEPLTDIRQRLEADPNLHVRLLSRAPGMQLSESQRSAYIRAMSVRNALIDQGIAAARITLRVDTETPVSAASVAVLVEDKP